MKVYVLCALLCAEWSCAANPQVQQVAALKQQCVQARRAEEDAMRALGRSSSVIHEQCARWAWRRVR